MRGRNAFFKPDLALPSIRKRWCFGVCTIDLQVQMVVPRLEQHADSKQGLICKTIYSAQTTARVRSGEFGLSTLSCRPSNIINYLSLEDLKLPRRTTEQNAPPSLLCLSLRKKEVFSSGYCIYPSCQSPPTPRSHL